jgi:segregation and condensation protein A
MEYLNSMKQLSANHGIDINLAGEFLVMAATLMEIKSAMLLPREQTPEGEASAATDITDPRYELVQQLLEYKRFKEAAVALDRKQQEHQARFARIPATREGADDDMPPLDLDEVQIWDLLDAFERIMAEVGARKPTEHEVVYDDTPIDLHAADIVDRVKREKTVSFRQLIEGRKNRSEMIGVFLAMLELIRQRKIRITPSPDKKDIQIEPRPEEDRAPEQP